MRLGFCICSWQYFSEDFFVGSIAYHYIVSFAVIIVFQPNASDHLRQIHSNLLKKAI